MFVEAAMEHSVRIEILPYLAAKSTRSGFPYYGALEVAGTEGNILPSYNIQLSLTPWDAQSAGRLCSWYVFASRMYLLYTFSHPIW